MDKYVEAELRLAELLGLAGGGKFHIAGQAIFVVGGAPEKKSVPQWARDNEAAFLLMVEQGCYPQEHTFGITCDSAWVVFSDHPSKEAAVRFCIVQAVIAKLEGEKK